MGTSKVVRSVERARWIAMLAATAIAGCSTAMEDGAGPAGANPGAIAGGAAGVSGAAGTDAAGAPANAAGTGATNTAGSSAGAGVGPIAGTGTGTGGAAAPEEMLDPAVDWSALTIVYPTMYSAFDGEHTFQLPAYVDGATVELSDWTAIPSRAVTFDPDPESGGVIITIVEPVEEITIAASSGMIGGTAPLHVTIATPEEWALGEARYNNGVDYDLPMLDFAQLIDPNWQPPEPPDNLACNNCHTTGAKYFEIQHTPTQAARFSDEELIRVFTEGIKPEGVGYSLLPPDFEHLYVKFHTWVSPPEEQKGLVVYLRSLTPEGQGDVRLPDGTFAPPGTEPPMP